MEEKSLRITGANTSFLNKITSKLTKMLTPTKVGINGFLVNIKRNALIKAFENCSKETDDYNQDELEKRYESSYTAYLEALDKYVMDSIYKKVKNGTASEYEKNALSQYYNITSLKDKEYMDYKYRKQKYLIELDNEGNKISLKERQFQRYQKFYISKMDMLYKSILKNYSIKLADTVNIYDTSKDWIYSKIFITLEEYILNILPLKIKDDKTNFEDVMSDYEKFQNYEVGKLDNRDNIEKNLILLGISRKLFTHSIPLVVAEQCYKKLLKEIRILIQDTKVAAKRERAYNLLMNIIEDYNVRLLSTKVYWEDVSKRETHKIFWDKYKQISNLKEIDFVEYVKQKEILFMKNDIKEIENEKFDYSKIITYYKRKLVDYGALRQLRNSFKSVGRYHKQSSQIYVAE